MNTNDQALIAKVAIHTGDRVSSIARTFYEFNGKLEETEGEVQVRFTNSVIRFQSSPGGERIQVTSTEWSDPFEGRMTPENVQFIRAHGQWQLLDVSNRKHYSAMIGKPLIGVLPLTNRYGTLIGFQLDFGSIAMNVFVHADEVHVSWGQDGIPRWGHEWADD